MIARTTFVRYVRVHVRAFAATRLANFLSILAAKEFWKSANIWRR